MVMERKRSRHGFMSRTPLFCCISICFFSVCALISTIGTRAVCLDFRSLSGTSIDCYFQELEKTVGKWENQGIPTTKSKSRVSFSSPRRILSGPGSFPPRCTGKCGKCTPCKPVHVPVPPGTPVTSEYYPEAWRCKCGNKLYMP